MTRVPPTVTQELQVALSHISNAEVTVQETTAASVISAREAIERALKQIQHARCEAVAALDWL